MSKKYKGKTCVYCAKPKVSSTGDHVVARGFFPENERHGIPIVPACAKCNGEKSEIEHYLTAILPKGARHTTEIGEFEKRANDRIAKNQRLADELGAGAKTTLTHVPGLGFRSETSLPFDGQSMMTLAAMMAKGLLFHHWGVVVDPRQSIEPVFLNEDGDLKMAWVMAFMRRQPGVPSIGPISLAGGAFEYEAHHRDGIGDHSIVKMNLYKVQLANPQQQRGRTSNMYVKIQWQAFPALHS